MQAASTYIKNTCKYTYVHIYVYKFIYTCKEREREREGERERNNQRCMRARWRRGRQAASFRT